MNTPKRRNVPKKFKQNIVSVVFRSEHQMDVVNIKTWVKRTDVMSFDEYGEPYSDAKMGCYKICGGRVGTVPWGDIIRHKKYKGKPVNTSDIIGDDLEDKIGRMLDDGTPNIFIYKNYNMYGMGDSYNCDVETIITASPPSINDFDWSMWNKLLKKIGSDWRILDDSTKASLNELRIRTMNII